MDFVLGKVYGLVQSLPELIQIRRLENERSALAALGLDSKDLSLPLVSLSGTVRLEIIIALSGLTMHFSLATQTKLM